MKKKSIDKLSFKYILSCRKEGHVLHFFLYYEKTWKRWGHVLCTLKIHERNGRHGYCK